MSTLFVNAAFRANSKTLRLAKAYLENKNDVTTLELGDIDIEPLKRDSLDAYCKAVANKDYSDPMFDFGKQFAQMDEIVIAAPFWNYSIPAVLHDYLELCCSQGVTFDLAEDGSYYSLCKAKRLVFITTAGGYLPKVDHHFNYIKDLCEVFWNIQDVKYIKADGVDIIENDKEAILEEALEEIRQLAKEN